MAVQTPGDLNFANAMQANTNNSSSTQKRIANTAIAFPKIKNDNGQ
jgi:hypothetical protein